MVDTKYYWYNSYIHTYNRVFIKRLFIKIKVLKIAKPKELNYNIIHMIQISFNDKKNPGFWYYPMVFIFGTSTPNVSVEYSRQNVVLK